MKKVLVMLLIFAAMAFSQSKIRTFPLKKQVNPTTIVGTYANSQTDTLIFIREAGVSGITFSAHWSDSVQLGTTKAGNIMRVYDGTQMAILTGDSLSLWTNFASTTDGSTTSITFSNGASLGGTVTMTPLADQYVFIITYAAAHNGVTTPTVKYEVEKQYYSGY